MKPFMITIGLLLSGYIIQAQTFGIRAGFNLSNQLDKNDYINYSEEQEFKMLPGGHLGMSFTLPVYKSFSFEAGALFTTKGYKRRDDTAGDLLIVNSYLFYLQAPIHIKYEFKIKSLNLFALAGSYFGYGVLGKKYAKNTIGNDTEKTTETYNWGTDPQTDDFRNFDTGLSFGGGIKFKSFVFGLSYELGLNNISTNTDDGAIIKNKVFCITTGYNFGKNNKPIFKE